MIDPSKAAEIANAVTNQVQQDCLNLVLNKLVAAQIKIAELTAENEKLKPKADETALG